MRTTSLILTAALFLVVAAPLASADPVVTVGPVSCGLGVNGDPSWNGCDINGDGGVGINDPNCSLHVVCISCSNPIGDICTP